MLPSLCWYLSIDLFYSLPLFLSLNTRNPFSLSCLLLPTLPVEPRTKIHKMDALQKKKAEEKLSTRGVQQAPGGRFFFFFFLDSFSFLHRFFLGIPLVWLKEKGEYLNVYYCSQRWLFYFCFYFHVYDILLCWDEVYEYCSNSSQIFNSAYTVVYGQLSSSVCSVPCWYERANEDSPAAIGGSFLHICERLF